MGDTGNLGNREVMDDKLYKAATSGNLVSFVEEARHNELESGLSEEYFLSQTEMKENILHLAIRSRQNDDFIEKVLKGEELLPRAVTDQLIKQQDYYGDNPLHEAVRVGNIEFFKLLFEYQQEATVLTPVRMALSIQNTDGDTPLHLALIEGKDDVALLLVKHYPDLAHSVKNNDGNTPLHLAAGKGNTELFKSLFDYQEGQQEAKVMTPVGINAGLSMQNNAGNTPLHLALIYGRNEIATLLVKHYPDLAHGVKNNGGNTPLHVAAEEGNIEVFKILFEYQEGQQVMTPVGINAGLSMQNDQGNTPLHIALIKGKDAIASLLAKHCPDLTRTRKNNDGNTPLHVAAEVGNTECFKLLLEYDLNQAEVTNGDGNTPLHVAILKLRDEIATFLLERRPELLLVTNNIKETPLHLAIEQYRQIIKLQIKEREAIGSTYIRMIKLMIEKDSCVACMQDATGATPLHRASSITSTYTLQIIRLMLDHCPQSVVGVLDNSGKTILHLLKTIPSYKEAKALLDIPELFGLINHQDNDGNTPLHWAAMNLNHNMVRALLDSSAVQSIRRNNDGITAEALIQEQFEVIMEKKQMTMEVCEATERADVTFLRERLHQFGMIFLFPRDSNRRNILHKLLQLNTGMTMLHTDFVDFIKEVLESFPELICQVDLNGDTPLHILLQNSPNTMIPSMESCNYEVLPLSKSPLVLKLLKLFCSYFERAQEEASVKGGRYDPPWLVQNAVGNTPIHEALRVNHGKKVVKKLLKLDIAVTAKLTNNLNETPLHLVGGRPEAAEPLDEDDVKTLKEANTDAACTFDKNGLTPLLRAAQNYNLFIISTFLKQSPEATFMADEKYGKTLLHLLINHPSYSTKNLLKAHKELKGLLAYDDYEGNTPLHLAIKGGRFDHAINFLTDMGPKEIELLEKKNDAYTTPYDLISSASEIPMELHEILSIQRVSLGYRSVYGIAASNVDEYVNTIGVIAALLMTITFTAAFTVPGGAVQDSANEKSKGTPILVNDIAFQVFMFFDILTMCLSAMVLFCLLWILAADKKRKSVMLMDSSILLLLISFYTTLLTFMAGVYATTIYVKPWIAIYTLVICALLMIFMRKDIIVNYVGQAGPLLSLYWKRLCSYWLGLIKWKSTKNPEEEE